jgi:predicted phage terminase large subunit-like protein
MENLSVNEVVIKERLERHKIDQCFVEANSFGAYFIRNIREQNEHVPITAIKNQTNKHGRILAQSGFILEFFVFPENPNEELSKFIRQMTSVSVDTKDGDDAADSIAGLAAAIRRNYYK